MDIFSHIKNTSKQLCVIVLFFWSRWELIDWSLQISNLLFCSCLYDGSVAFENFNGSFFSTLFLPRLLGHGTVSLFPLCPLPLPSSSTFYFLGAPLKWRNFLEFNLCRWDLRMTPKAIFPSLISLLRFRPIFPNGSEHTYPTCTSFSCPTGTSNSSDRTNDLPTSAAAHPVSFISANGPTICPVTQAEILNTLQ